MVPYFNNHNKPGTPIVKKLSLFLTALILPILVQAQNMQYVNDQLIITLRTGQGSQYQILKTLPSGTRLEVLETGEDTGYTKVRVADGMEGWVLSRYLTPEPIAKEKLAVAESKLQRLLEQNNALKEELVNLKKSSADLEAERNALLSQTDSASAELERLNQVAAQPILLDKQNRELKQQNVSLEKELQLIQQENQVLKERSQREWFIAGAGVLLGGMLLGLILPKLRWRKKSGW
jgi:SH3 domain protein